MPEKEQMEELEKLEKELENWKEGIKKGLIGGNATPHIIAELEAKIEILRLRLGLK